VAEIVGFENRVVATVRDVDGEDAILAVGAVILRAKGRFPSGSRVVACVRGEDISLGAGGCESKKLNRLTGKIIELLPGVLRHRLAINCGGVALVALLDRKESQAMALERGSEVTACFDAETVHVIADEGLY